MTSLFISRTVSDRKPHPINFTNIPWHKLTFYYHGLSDKICTGTSVYISLRQCIYWLYLVSIPEPSTRHFFINHAMYMDT